MVGTVLRYLVPKDNSKDLRIPQIIKATIAILPASCKDTAAALPIATSPKGTAGRFAAESPLSVLSALLAECVDCI
jgi:hypothetical protein